MQAEYPHKDSVAISNQKSIHKNSGKKLRHNIVKINLYSLVVKNYSFYYERQIAKKISIQVGYRFQPYGYLSDNLLAKQMTKYGADIDFRYYSFKVSNSSITLDMRFYPGKKSDLRGFYLGVYGRYTHFDLDNTEFNYVTKNEQVYNVPLVSNFNGIGGGLELGRQFIIKNRISIDCYFVGGHYGSLKGSLVSHKDLSGLSEPEKKDLRSSVSDLYTFAGTSYLTALTVNNKGLNGTVSGPFWGLRTGIVVGIAF